MVRQLQTETEVVPVDALKRLQAETAPSRTPCAPGHSGQTFKGEL
jgi:hypothetical protein